MDEPLRLAPEDVSRGVRGIFDQVQRIQTDISDGSVFEVEPGSSLAGDNRVSDPYHVAHGAAGAVGTAVEHLDAVRALIMDAQALHPAAPFTLARAAIETSAAAVWLLGPRSRPERVARRLQQILRDAQDGDRAAGELGLGPKKPLAIRRDELLEQARRVMGDSTYKLKASEMTSIVRYADEVVVSNLHILTAWRVCSGFTHGRLWTTLSMLDREVIETEDPRVVHLRVTSSLDRVLWVLTAAMDVINCGLKLYEQRRMRYV